MSDFSEVISEHESFAIPWGLVKERQPMSSINWLSPQKSVDIINQHMESTGNMLSAEETSRILASQKRNLEKVTLMNNLRYVRVIDSKTGMEAYDTYEYNVINGKPSLRTPPKAVIDVDLGDGYLLNMILAFPDRNGEKASSSSYVEKKFNDNDGNGNPVQHNFHYQVDAPQRFINGAYDFQGNGESTSVRFNTEYNNQTDSYEQNLNFIVSVAEITTHSQVEFHFDSKGLLSAIILAGRSFLGAEGAILELLTLHAAEQRGVIKLAGEQLGSPGAKEIIKRILEIDSNIPLELDIKASLSKLIENADRNHLTPRKALVFKNEKSSIDSVKRLPEMTQ